jgi:threonine dehydrogenase-like Zn-dependent dehydrogenase
LEAAPANCALATVVAGWESVELRPFENVLIQGAGTLGMFAAALARHYGCNRIIATDIRDDRLEAIRAFGATDTINTRGMKDDELVQIVRDLTAGFGVDSAIEVAGVPDLIPQGLRCLRIGGRYVEQGCSFPNASFTYNASDILWRRLSIRGVHNYDARHLQMGIDFLALTRHEFPFERLVTHQVSLEDINAGLRLASSASAIRVAVIPTHD